MLHTIDSMQVNLIYFFQQRTYVSCFSTGRTITTTPYQIRIYLPYVLYIVLKSAKVTTSKINKEKFCCQWFA